MAQTFHELGFKIGAEIGVAQGNHAKILCENNPGLKLYCIDVWEQYHGYREYTNRIVRYYGEAKERLAPYDCILIKKFSMDAVKDFADGSLDFVHIDGAHDFKNVADDVCEWTKKVRIDGIVYGHDFKRSKGKYLNAVKDVVPAYCYQYGIRPWFIFGAEEGIRSWMWIR
jgi:predicted O-methyltransferase YrrM